MKDEREAYFDVWNDVEDRFNITGVDAGGKFLTVSYTWRGARRRIITARKAEKHEIEDYYASRF